MADDIKLKYGSTGFERIRKELKEMETIGATSGSWFKSMQIELRHAEQQGETFTQGLKSGLQSVMPYAAGVVGILAKVAIGITAIAGVAGGIGVAAFTSWNMTMLKTTEGFRQMEISLLGALKSEEAVERVSKFAKEYAATYPAMYGQVMQAMQSLAFIPAMKGPIQRGDIDVMKEFMHIVQGMMTMRPEQGVQGAIYALREALAGNWRSLMFRFDVPIASIAKSAGMTMEEMKAGPQEAIKALKSWVNEFVGADTMALAAKNLSIQMGNLKDKYEIWLDTLGKSGIYQKVVGYLLKMNDVFDAVLNSEKLQKWTKDLNKFLEDVVDRIAGIFTKGIDWENIESLSGLWDALKKVVKNAEEELKKAWGQIKEPLAAAISETFKFIATAAVAAFSDIMIPGIKTVMNAVTKQINKEQQESPVTTTAVKVLAPTLLGGAVGGLPGALVGLIAGGIGVGLEATMGFVFEKVRSVRESLSKIKDDTKGTPSLVEKLELDKAKKAMEEINELLQFRAIKSEGFRAQLGLGPNAPAKGMKWPSRFPFLEETGETIGKAFEMTGTQEFEKYSAWSRMAGMLAQKQEVPYEKRPFYQWYTGKLSDEEYKKSRNIEEFNVERQKRLGDILEGSGAKKEYGLQSKVYGEMFNIAYQRGDFGKAQEYMNKSIEAMVKQMEKEDQRGEADTKNLSTLATDAGTIRTMMEKYSVKGSTNKFSNIPSSGDETTAAVRNGLENN